MVDLITSLNINSASKLRYGIVKLYLITSI